MKPLPSLGEQESEILRYIGEQPPVSVRDVAAQFSGLARTTVLTMMERLRRKGYLQRVKLDGVFKYSAKVQSEVVMKKKITDFVEKTLGGSMAPLINYFSSPSQLDESEVEKLRALVAEFDRKKESP